jgi:hypothetical protein
VKFAPSPIANVIGICATEGSTAAAPAAGEDPAAAFRVATVELHQVVAS